MRRRPLTAALALAAVLAVGPVAPVLGYANNQPGQTLGGGAHRKINQIAGGLFMREIVKGEEGAAFKRYDFLPLSPSGKYKVVALNADVSPDAVANVFRPAGLTVTARVETKDKGAEYEAASKTVNSAFSGWVIDGGFTADEPELYMSLRHFYNPVTDLGPAYLTDIPAVMGSLVMGANPQVDAVTWATTASDNPYNWMNGTRELSRALTANTVAEAQWKYAAAWRSLGETMHLAADMSVPAHVRNDSHPGDWRAAALLADMRADAYEYITNWSWGLEQAWLDRQLDPDLLAGIRADVTPDAVMTTIAGWVNSHFFSTDTIPYVDWTGTTTALNVGAYSGIGVGNGIVYPAPVLDPKTLDPKTGYYTIADASGAPLIMAHTSWLKARGWGSYPGQVNYEVVQSQAQRLVPTAIWGAERLMELFMPLVEVKVASVKVDPDTQAPVVSGTIAVRPVMQGGGYAATPDPNLMKDTEQSVLLFVRLTRKDGATEERTYLAPPTDVKDGEFEIDLADCTNADGLHDIIFPGEGTKPAFTKVEYAVGLDMGGVLVRSDYPSDAGLTLVDGLVSAEAASLLPLTPVLAPLVITATQTSESTYALEGSVSKVPIRLSIPFSGYVIKLAGSAALALAGTYDSTAGIVAATATVTYRETVTWPSVSVAGEISVVGEIQWDVTTQWKPVVTGTIDGKTATLTFAGPVTGTCVETTHKTGGCTANNLPSWTQEATFTVR